MENLVEKKENKNNEEVTVKRILKSFSIVAKEGSKGTYYNLIVKTHKGKECSLYLSDTQKEVIDEVGLDNCYVDVVSRTSKENRKYNCICLFVGDFTFDFFPKDRAFITLAIIHSKL